MIYRAGSATLNTLLLKVGSIDYQRIAIVGVLAIAVRIKYFDLKCKVQKQRECHPVRV